MMAKVVLPVVPVFSFLWFEDKVTRYLDNTHYFYICTMMSRMIVSVRVASARVPRHGVYIVCTCVDVITGEELGGTLTWGRSWWCVDI